MKTSIPFGGGECHAPLHEECRQHPGHKGDIGLILETCGAIVERESK